MDEPHDLYLSGLSLREVSKAVGIPAPTLRYRFNKLGIVRPISDAVKLAYSKRAAREAHNRLTLTGKTFGRLLVVSPAGTRKEKSIWNCVCLCGEKRIINGSSLTTGNSKSCGCLGIEGLSNRSSHGMTGTRVYRIWQAMLNRCRNSGGINWENYGGRGISVCERWERFENFFSDMGSPPKTFSIERIDNNGDYCPENCKWASRVEQSRNKRANRFIEFNGEAKCLTDWARGIGINQASLRERLDKWPLDEALTKQKRI